MKKTVCLLFVFLLISWALPVFPSNFESIARGSFIKIRILEDGKKTNEIWIANFSVFKINDRVNATWSYVRVWHRCNEGDGIILTPWHYSIEDGGITNLIVGENNIITFNLNIDFDRTYQMIVKLGGPKFIPILDIEGSGLWWSDILERNIIRIGLRVTFFKFSGVYKILWENLAGNIRKRQPLLTHIPYCQV